MDKCLLVMIELLRNLLNYPFQIMNYYLILLFKIDGVSLLHKEKHDLILMD